jgi:transposase
VVRAVVVGVSGGDGDQFERASLGARLLAMGLDARIVSAQLAAPYRAEGACGKNDANDAAAICEAGGRPHMRFIPVKSVDQQSMLCVHRLREGLKADRTACINRIRGLLLVFGIAVPAGVKALSATLDDILEDASNELNGLARSPSGNESGIFICRAEGWGRLLTERSHINV